MQPYTIDSLRVTVLGGIVFVVFLLGKKMIAGLGDIAKIGVSIPLLLAVYSMLMYKWGMDEKDKILNRDKYDNWKKCAQDKALVNTFKSFLII